MRSCHRFRFILALTAFGSAATFGQAPVPGEKWRTTTQMEMEGMSMPGMTRENCVPVGQAAEAFSAPQQENCEVYDVSRSGNRFAAKVRCTGKDAFEGTVEQIADGPDKYRGTMKMRTADGEMTMRIASSKLPGSCDAGAEQRRVNALFAKAQQDRDAEIAAQCRAAVAKLPSDPGQVGGALLLFFQMGDSKDAPPAMCSDAAQKAAVCKALGTRAGFLATQQTAPNYKGQNYSLERFVPACSLGTVPTLRTRLLAEAEQVGDWEFLRKEAPEQYAALLQRECAGRKFSKDIAPKYRGLCGAAALAATDSNADPANNNAANDAPSTTAASEAPPATTVDKTKDVAQKAKKALRGIFGGG
ncbi:MAG: DUF3617 family protein [Proteobacteria bacterium]|nr:DUF3617 family protein [Pseudomonadota bacterium]